jgi:PAS domain S-box-containing protein
MSLIKNIPARRRLLILVLVIILFGLISGLTFMHTMNALSGFRQLEQDFDNCFNVMHKIDHHLQGLGAAYLDETVSPVKIMDALNKDLSDFSGDIRELKKHRLLADHSAIQESLTEILHHISAFESRIATLILQHTAVEPVRQYADLHAEFIDPVNNERIFIRDRIYELSFLKQRRYSTNLIMLMFLNIAIITLAVIVNIINNSKNASRLVEFVSELEKGKRPGKLHLNANNEHAEIAAYLNSLLDKQEEKIRFLKTIGEESGSEERETAVFEPGEGDVIGHEIKIMAERLRKIQAEQQIRQSADKKRNWTSDGIARFAEILRSERENVTSLSYLVIQKLVTYLNIEMGTILLISDREGEEKVLETIASYAYDRRKYISKTFRFGEGLPGTCALEKEKIYIDEIPEAYSDVISGVGRTKPRCVLLVPMKIEEEIFGILELASFRTLEQHELDFVDQLAESIASTLLSVKTNERTAALLQQSRNQAGKLLQQEEEMKRNMAELQKARDESMKKESELTGILNAMNESSLVAEYGLNGRFTHINDKFLELLESPAETVLGKHHNEFAVVDRYAESYTGFWERLKNGTTISREDRFKLFSGKEIWLQQTFTPIRNQDGRIYKILNIAVDITHARKQQSSLERQAAEIRRQNLEMESLNQAVNSSIIKCELDHEGIILDTNTNFEMVSGLNRKEFLGRNYRLFLKEMETEQFEKIWQEVLKGKTYEGAIRRTKPTGEEVWLMSTFSPVKDEGGMIYKIYFLALDITEKKLKYQLLEEANKEIERLRNEK